MTSSIPQASGVYKITCTVTGKFYIGSAINLYARQNRHFYTLRHGTHGNPKLQAAWNKYGEQSFIFEVIEFVLFPEMLIAREQYWFDTFQPFDKKGFNIDRVAGSSLGREISLEQRKKLSQANLGKKFSPESIKKRIQSRTSFGHTPETCERLRVASLGNTNMLGKSPSSITREKLRDWNKSRMKTLIVTSPSGLEFTITGIRQFCEEHHLNRSNLMHVAKGNKLSHKGWKARFPD